MLDMDEDCHSTSYKMELRTVKRFSIVLFFSHNEAVIWGTLPLIANISHVVAHFYDLIMVRL